jgi:hypothetical protein
MLKQNHSQTNLPNGRNVPLNLSSIPPVEADPGLRDFRRLFLSILQPQKKRCFLGALLCLSLAFMVFAWGTGYKLSLYKADQHSEPAKVCIRGSNAAKSDLDHSVDGHKVQQASASMTLVSVLDIMHSCPLIHGVPAGSAKNLLPLRSRPILHLRPPPAGLRLLD